MTKITVIGNRAKDEGVGKYNKEQKYNNTNFINPEGNPLAKMCWKFTTEGWEQMMEHKESNNIKSV